MDLNEKTRLSDLLKEYPFLLDFLVNLKPEYQKLKNPLLRKTVGRFADLAQVAEMGKVSLAELIRKISTEITEHGQKLTGTMVQEATGELDARARVEALKQIIGDLHRGGDLDSLKNRFAALIKDVTPEEIARLEQQVIEEGLPEEEVKRLCDLHVKIFEESLEAQKFPETIPGHPVHTLMLENRALEKILEDIKNVSEGLKEKAAGKGLAARLLDLPPLLSRLAEIDKHYLKKENQLFPLLEERGVVGPTKVMWAIHDDIRKELKELRRLSSSAETLQREHPDFISRIGQLVQMAQDMIYKEEKILFPMSLEVLTEEDWVRVKQGEEEIGYAWIKPGSERKVEGEVLSSAHQAAKSSYAANLTGSVGPEPGATSEPVKESELRPDRAPARRIETILNLNTGKLTPDQVDLILTHLPVDISFVDENDTVVYYSDTPDRVFPRSPGVIGRKVQNCHPPRSVHVVSLILEAFKKGEKNVAEFWIQLRGRFIHITYFAVRDVKGQYCGCLEVSQDVTGIRALQGQERLLDWE